MGIQSKLDVMTGGVTNLCLHLVHGVGGVNKLGHVEADILDLVLALDLGDGDVLGDAHLLGGRVGETALDGKGSSDKGDLVGLGLVLLVSHLVRTMVGVSSLAVSSGLDSTGSQ